VLDELASPEPLLDAGELDSALGAVFDRLEGPE
jgi:hypothetical protein